MSAHHARRITLWLATILITLGGVAISHAVVPPWEIEALPHTTAPPFSLPDLSGKQLDSASLAGKARLINFWATWCAPCREEMPDLDKLQRKFTDQGLVVIGIAIDSEKTAIKDFIGKTKTGFPILHDPEMKIHDAYKVYTYPTTFLIDRKGIIKKYWLGAQDWNGAEIEKILRDSLR